MEPLLLGGDFNDWNFKVHDFISDKLGFKDSHHEVNLNFAKTFPSLSPFLCLDRLYTRNLKPIAAESLNSTAWKSLSDHLPLYTELIIKDF
jgi:endonuclease/exonuclease/phosphatase family metal-dependent hydrolase